jgi:hypothetical protein
MGIETKKQNPLLTSKINPALAYKRDNSAWGLSGFYEGYKLIFSGVFGKSDNKLKKIFSVVTGREQQNQNSIITNVDLYGLFSPSAKRAWNNACASAAKRRGEAGIEDIFLALLKEESVKNLLLRMKVSTETAEIFLKNYLKLTPACGGEALQIIPFEAFALALKIHNHKIGSLMLLGALLNTAPQDNILQAIFSNIGLTPEKLEVFAVWLLGLNHEFPKNSHSAKVLYCLKQAQGLEQHFGYFFECPAIEQAVRLSQNQTLKDLEHQKALQFLVKAAGLAKNKNLKTVSENLVIQAAQK